MADKNPVSESGCIHHEKRVLRRISRGDLLDRRPDLIIYVCNFPLPEPSRIQCLAMRSVSCPCGGPYGSN